MITADMINVGNITVGRIGIVDGVMAGSSWVGISYGTNCCFPVGMEMPISPSLTDKCWYCGCRVSNGDDGKCPCCASPYRCE